MNPDAGDVRGAGDTAEAILGLFRRKSGRRLGIDDMRKLLTGEHPDLAGAIDRLLAEGLLWRVRKGRYALPEELGMARGILRVRPGGTGVLTADGGVRVSVGTRDLGTALDGDTVLVRKLSGTTPGEYRGRVEAVLTRSRKGVSGITRGAGSGWVICPLDPRLPDRIRLRTGGREPEAGRIAYADLDYTGKGGVVAVLRRTMGDPSSPSVLIDSVVADAGIPVAFPKPVLEEAVRVSSDPPGGGGERKDCRDILTITVDPADARDFDDAVSLEETADGRSVLGVHIADVSAFVPPGSVLDDEAFLRGTSVYLPDRVIPMLPESLSNGACSLRPGEDRLAVSVMITLDSSARRLDFSIEKSVIRSDHRLTYEDVLEVMEGGGSGDGGLDRLIAGFAKLSDLLTAARDERGALDLGSLEFRTSFDESGLPSGFDPVPDDRSHGMIENFMIEANRAVADYCSWIPLPVLYRVHGEPSEGSLDELRVRLGTLGIALPRGHGVHSGDLNRILEAVRGTPASQLVREMVLRSMKKAVYSPGNEGHYGLALASYLHFTSPIRRYPDLIVHQALSGYLAGTDRSVPRSIAEEATAAGGTERRAEAMERSSTELMGLVFLSKRKGEAFDGVVSGVKDFGLFVRLAGVPVEGLVPVRFLREMGYHSTTRFREGESIRVEVVQADPVLRTLTLFPAEHPGRSD